MNKIEFLPYPEVPCLNGKAEKLVVFLHGLGSDGDDLIALAPYFQKDLPNAHFISPHGVQAYDMAPFGRQWFSLQDRNPEVIINLARENAIYAGQIIQKKQSELGVNNKDTIIIGFSQGTMMGMYLTLIQEEPFGAMIGYSGRLIPPLEVKNTKTPVCLVHGLDDQIVPVSEIDKLAEFCQLHNIKCETLVIPNLAHSIDASGIIFATKFLNENLQ